MEVRAAEEHEVDQLAAIWFDGWQDAHAQILPAELMRLRTMESFRERLQCRPCRISGLSGRLRARRLYHRQR